MASESYCDPQRWPRKNAPEDVERRREALRRLPGWEPVVDVFEVPEPLAGPFSRAMELYTGCVALPVAVVGPLAISLGDYRHGDDGRPVEVDRRTESVFVPIAHTEGGLSASMQRGAVAVALSGGFVTHVLQDRITRDSCFFFDSTADAVAFARWVETQVDAMRAWLADPENPWQASADELGGPRPISRHAVLREVRTHVVGPYCHVLYRFTTGEACGPNMMTRNAYALNQGFIPERAQAAGVPLPKESVLEANMGGDKKPSYLYFQEGHGKTVLAEATLGEAGLARLRVEPERILALADAGLHGSHASGMQSMAFTPASAVAAIFAATGQDLGMVGTSSMAHGVVTRTPAGLHFSIRLPGLEVGTVGGGTMLPHARSYLRLMGCEGPGSAMRFAQIVAAAVLALEISATAAMAVAGSYDFYRAHRERGGLREAGSATGGGRP
ncbi:MAG: 3-hydroxy-3-methylglutaryl-CoA reductase [Clostridia bacterium]|nr:3-hydroxy-3-methylglutaryl-CoA reductase [Clostridia bacterium]